MPDVLTNADPVAAAWAITDPVIRLRLFGSERVFPLADADHWILGAASACAIQLHDPTGRVSRRHLELSRGGRGAWAARDLGSTNGIRHNGDTRASFQLAPGDELELGGVTLIAESQRSMALHELLHRLLGWSTASIATVDRAFRAVHEMAILRGVLILRGKGPLHGLARELHQRTLQDRPFVLVGANESGEVGLARAADGMLCVDARALPSDVARMISGVAVPGARVRLVVCAETAGAAAGIAALLPRCVSTLKIPPVGERAHELDRLFEAYGLDAMRELEAPTLGFRQSDLAWVRAIGAATLDEIATAARRVVALRNWNVTAAAERLGISRSALSHWAQRRRLQR
jgi:hypothetical protein